MTVRPPLTRDAEEPLYAPVQDRVDSEEEDGRDRHHDEHHDRRDHGLAAAGPGYLGALLTDLLQKLKRIGLAHLFLPKKMAGEEGLDPSPWVLGARRSTN